LIVVCWCQFLAAIATPEKPRGVANNYCVSCEPITDAHEITGE